MVNFLEILDNIGLAISCVGMAAALISALFLFIYRKKKGIKHEINKDVSDEEYEDASEYREWYFTQSSNNNEDEE